MPASRSEEFEMTSFKDKRTDDVAASEEFLPGAIELRNLQPSSYLRTSSSAEHWENEAYLSNSKEMRSKFLRGSGNHQISTLDMKRSQRMSSSGGHWENEARLCNGIEMRMSFTDSECQSNQSPTHLATGRTLEEIITRRPYFHLSCSRNCTFMMPWNFIPFGLVNCGNSCYANAVLQCLAFTRPISSYLLEGLHSKTCCKRDWCFMCEFENLILKGQELRSPLSPIRILSQIQKIGSHLSHGREEDAHEFLRYAVDAMQSICLEESWGYWPIG
ncbi:ubiquitin carboxyl-terminal hydrolase 19 [Abeliophyllum distichum]|uniref:Ubiquitin carboxyl-terminal hydrolase 19 n=1 Tax=Abeliophyllum distichum TaxID=126358 RepID=A0ABD1SDT3_9LAMI